MRLGRMMLVLEASKPAIALASEKCARANLGIAVRRKDVSVHPRTGDGGSLLKKLFSCVFGSIHLANVWIDALVALPRFVCGIILPLKFGMSKFPPPQWFIEDVGKLGFPAPTFFAWAAVVSEVVASFMLAMGLATRLSALLVMVTMFVAAFVQKADAPLWERLPSLFFFLNAYFALVLGCGRIGLDSLLRKRLHIE